jgi:hypothetical protein
MILNAELHSDGLKNIGSIIEQYLTLTCATYTFKDEWDLSGCLIS